MIFNQIFHPKQIKQEKWQDQKRKKSPWPMKNNILAILFKITHF
jgi:hypothetical protein